MLFKKNIKKVEQRLNEIKKSNNKAQSKKDFEQIMWLATSILEKTNEKYPVASGCEHPLVDLVRLVGRKLQTEYLTNLLYQENESDLPDLNYEKVLFNSECTLSKDGESLEDLIKEVSNEDEQRVMLGCDLILPWPWKTQRLIYSMARIGEGRVGKAWRQDRNHWIETWLPMGVSWVRGGNHSITTGIIQGKGSITPTVINDISPVYDYIYCDGVNFYRIEDGAIISEVKNVEFAAIFEIGRLMHENSICY